MDTQEPGAAGEARPTGETPDGKVSDGTKLMATIFLLLTWMGQNQCKASDTALVRGYLMESSCAVLQYSGSEVRVRHSRECLKHTSRQAANFAVLEREGEHKLWHIDASANGDLVRHFTLLQDQVNVTVEVWGSLRKDQAKGDTITACAATVGEGGR